MKIIETDNYGGDYPDEKFVNLPDMSKQQAEKLCELINECFCHSRYWKVEENDYILQGGFEP